MSEQQAKLTQMLAPLVAEVSALHPEDKTHDEAAMALENSLAAKFSPDGEAMLSLQKLVANGISEGWLCNRGDDNARFSRIAKPTDQTAGLSIDVVSLEGAALEHTHPKGEVTIGFAAPGTNPESVKFDGRPPGWVFCQPNSRHTPTVTGGRMHLVYFIPGGEVIWHK